MKTISSGICVEHKWEIQIFGHSVLLIQILGISSIPTPLALNTWSWLKKTASKYFILDRYVQFSLKYFFTFEVYTNKTNPLLEKNLFLTLSNHDFCTSQIARDLQQIVALCEKPFTSSILCFSFMIWNLTDYTFMHFLWVKYKLIRVEVFVCVWVCLRPFLPWVWRVN